MNHHTTSRTRGRPAFNHTHRRSSGVNVYQEAALSNESSFWAQFEDRLAVGGVDAVLAEWEDSESPELADQLRRVLILESHHLRDPEHSPRTEYAAQQVLTRAHAVGASTLVKAVIDHLRAERRLVLCELWRTQPFSPALVRTLSGHGSGILDLAFAPDGRLYSIAGDGRVRVWDVAAGTATLVDFTSPDEGTTDGGSLRARRLAVSPDGALLAVGFSDRTIRVRSLTGNYQVSTLGSQKAILCIRFFSDGSRRLVSSSEDGTVALWDPASGRLVRTFEGHTSMVAALAVSSDGQTVMSGSYDHTVRIWDSETGRCRQVVDNGDDGWVTGVAFTAYDTTVLTTSEYGAVHRYAVEHGRLRDRTRFRNDRSGRFGPGIAWSVTPIDERRALIANDDAVVDVLNTRPFDPSSSREASLTGHGHYTRDAAVSPDRRLAVTGDDGGRILVWDTYATTSVPDTPLGLYFGVERIAVSADKQLVVYSPQQARRICARDSRTGQQRWLVDEEDSIGPQDMWFSPGGFTLYTTVEYNKVEHRSSRTGEVQRTVTMPGSVQCGVGDWIVTADARQAAIADTSVGIVKRSVVLPSESSPRRAAATPNLATVVFGGDGVLTSWHTATGETTTVRLARQPATSRSKEVEAYIFDIAVDNEGCHALGADAAGRAHIWDIRAGEVTVVRADSDQVQSVAGLAQHRAITVGFRDGLATVWDLTSAQPACIAPLDSLLTAVAVDGSDIVIGDTAGNAHVLTLLQGDPTPPPPPPPPPTPRPSVQAKRPSLLRRILGTR